jgi:hypothetical protein
MRATSILLDMRNMDSSVMVTLVNSIITYILRLNDRREIGCD